MLLSNDFLFSKISSASREERKTGLEERFRSPSNPNELSKTFIFFLFCSIFIFLVVLTEIEKISFCKLISNSSCNLYSIYLLNSNFILLETPNLYICLFFLLQLSALQPSGLYLLICHLKLEVLLTFCF